MWWTGSAVPKRGLIKYVESFSSTPRTEFRPLTQQPRGPRLVRCQAAEVVEGQLQPHPRRAHMFGAPDLATGLQYYWIRDRTHTADCLSTK